MPALEDSADMLDGPTRLKTLLDAIVVPEAIRRHPGMISSNERTFLYDLARTYYTGQGVIVDAGVFLGCSTACFANGVRNNAKQTSSFKKTIFSFDMAVCTPPTLANIRYHKIFDRYPLEIGQSFAPLLEEMVEPYSDLVSLNVGDITTTIDVVEEPIEILFIDVFKTAEISEQVLRHVFPKLIPNVSIVIHQDFYHPWLPWIHVSMGRMADCFEYLGSAACSSVYLCKKVPDSDVLYDQFWSSAAPEDVLRAFDLGCSVAKPGYEAFVLAQARAILFRRLFGKEKANEYLSSIQVPKNRIDSFEFNLPPIQDVRNVINSDHLW